MNDTYVTVVGNLASDLTRRVAGTSEVVNFRLASNARRQLPDGSWEDYNTTFFNVSCWGRLVTGVSASLKKGDRVIVTGTLHVNEYVTNEGVSRMALELRAKAIGPELSSCIAQVQKLGRPAEPQGYPESPDGEPKEETGPVRVSGFGGSDDESERHSLSA